MKLDLKQLKNITILYIEDEQLIREQTSSMFLNLFKEVFIAENGGEAYDIYCEKKEIIDVIISDINMPVMGGLEFAEKLSLESNKIPIILTTAFTDEEFLLKSFELSISKYVTKPLKIKELTQIVIEVVEKYRKNTKLERATKTLATQTKVAIQENEKLKINFDSNEKELLFLRKVVNNFVSKIRLTPKGVILEVTIRFQNLYGYSNEEILEKEVSLITENSGTLPKKMLEATRAKEAVEFVDNFRFKNGTVVKFDNTLVPNYEDNSGLVSSFELYQTIIL